MKIAAANSQPRRIKARFIAPFALMLVFVMCVFAVAIYAIEAQVRERDLDERSEAVATLFTLKMDKDANRMLATLRALMTNESIMQSFARLDRKALEQLGSGLFKALSTEHKITHLYFIRPDLVSLYRFHNPEAFGDAIHRVTLERAQASQRAAHGLELGPMGTLTLRLVVPWHHGDKLLGYVEIGEEIEHLIDEIRDSLGIDLMVLADKRYLTSGQWQLGQKMMHRAGNWQRFASHAVLAQTTDQMLAGLDQTLLQQIISGSAEKIDEGGRSYHLASVPIRDAGQRSIGELVLMRDVSSLEETFQYSMLAVIVISLLVAGGGLGIFYMALERVERDYRRQHDMEHQLLRLDSEHKRILQMEKLSALGTMVGGIAHQLNNPLVGVVNMAQLAERELDEQGDPSRTRELLAEIRRAGSDCRAFVRRMLEFSKVSCFESKPTALASLIDDTVLMFRQTEARHLPVEVELPNAPPELVIDPILVRHALFNLLQNAAQATAGNATITIRLEAQIDPASGAPAWRLSVSDRGRGIAPEAMERIFVPFFTTRSDGTGLGLPVVQQVALLHDGHVTAANRPEGGAEFAIWLPQ